VLAYLASGQPSLYCSVTVAWNVDFPQARRPFPALEKRAANVLFSAPAEEPPIPETTE
jgi:hypothetical protein